MGTIEYDLCGRKVRAATTTPGALELASLLRGCIDRGASAAVLEVSSHALDQKRTEGLRFAAAAFTNLSGDHLDYHRTFDAYRAAKARLFEGLGRDAVAVVNRDDPSHAQMIAACPARVVTFALERPADITAEVVATSSAGTRYVLRLDGCELRLDNALVGRHNVCNALAAAGLARAAGATHEAIATGLGWLRSVPGRLQHVECASDADVFVDYAHTDDALRNVLSVMKPLAAGRLIVLFGCGGDRDRAKRPRMAQAVAAFADRIVLTSDNPRSEDPLAIIDDALRGLDATAGANVLIEPDRARAIRLALAGSGKGDIVLLAGKGHETVQVIGDVRTPFDDVQEAIRAAAELCRATKGMHRP